MLRIAQCSQKCFFSNVVVIPEKKKTVVILEIERNGGGMGWALGILSGKHWRKVGGV